MVAKRSRRAQPVTSGAVPAESVPSVSTTRTWAMAGLLLLATFAAYGPVWDGGVLWDDEAHLTRPDLRSTDGLRRIWFDVGATQQYYPIVHSAFWLFNRLWGQDTLGYHLVNIALHVLSAGLLAFVLRRLRVPGGLLAATAFALHPVQVESVAWMTELKNTLSTACYLGSALAYLHYLDRRHRSLYATALLLFVVGLLSKTVVASLPAALLVVSWWKRGRIDWRDDVRPLLPFFVVGIAAATMTAWFERSILGAQGVEFTLGVAERVILAGRASWFYVSKLLWPAALTFIYPRWQFDAASLVDYLYPAGVLCVVAACWAIRRRTRGPLAATLLYLGALFPALGFVNVYPFRYSYVADHFQYLATVPALAALSAGLIALAARMRLPVRGAEAVPILLIGVPLGLLTWKQSHEYRDADTLFRATLAKNPSCWLCYNNLASAKLYRSEQEFEQAVAYLTEALRLNPLSAEAHNNMGGAHQRRGRLEDALKEHLEALRLNPKLVDARYNVGVVMQALGRTDEARQAYAEVLRQNPDYAQAHHNLGTLLAAANRFDEATRHLAAAVRLMPADWQARDNLGIVLLRAGHAEDALSNFREAVSLEPSAALARYHLAMALAMSGRLEDSIVQFEETLKLAPGSAEIHYDLGAALANAGRFSDAVKHFEAALRLRPDYPSAKENLQRALEAARKQPGR